jgi:hypothetical protein
MSPAQRAEGFVAANEALVSRYEGLDAQTRKELTVDLGFLPGAVDERRRGRGRVGAMQAHRVASVAGSVAGDVDADFRHQFGFGQRGVQRVAAAPSGGERPTRPWTLGSAGTLLLSGSYRFLETGDGAAAAQRGASSAGQWRGRPQSGTLEGLRRPSGAMCVRHNGCFGQGLMRRLAMRLFLLLIIVAVVLGIIGATADGLRYLLDIAIGLFAATMAWAAARWSRRTDRRTGRHIR